MLEPVEVGGVTVSRATLHNEEDINRKDIREGDTVIVQRAGDVIPQVVGPVLPHATGTKPFRMPERCPLCDAPVVKPEGEVMHRCPNRACPSRGLESLNNWVMAAADIEGVGEQFVRRLWDLGLVRSLPDLYRLTKEQLLELDGFQETSASNAIDAIAASKAHPVRPRPLRAQHPRRRLGDGAEPRAALRHRRPAARRRARRRSWRCEGIGPERAEAIAEWFADEENRPLVDELRELGLRFESGEEERPAEGPLTGKQYVITGTLESFTREEAKAALEAARREGLGRRLEEDGGRDRRREPGHEGREGRGRRRAAPDRGRPEGAPPRRARVSGSDVATDTVVVFAGGEPPIRAAVELVPAGAFVVAADSGADHALALGLHVDVAVGDFDSVTPEALAAVERDGGRIERHPAEKDKTDLELALDAAVGARAAAGAGRGRRRRPPRPPARRAAAARSGGVRGRRARRATRRRRRSTSSAASERSWARVGELISLVAVHGPAVGVVTEGLVYALEGETLEPGSSRGISNAFAATEARVAATERRRAGGSPGRRRVSTGGVGAMTAIRAGRADREVSRHSYECRESYSRLRRPRPCQRLRNLDGRCPPCAALRSLGQRLHLQGAVINSTARVSDFWPVP